MTKKQFAIIGLGGVGQSVALELMRLGYEVLGIDSSEERANAIADQLTQTVIVDATDESALRELKLKGFEAVMVAIGESIETSILSTMAVKSLGAREVWVKAITPLHHRIVQKIGADRIFHPEYEMGLRIAQSMAHPNMLDYISLGDDCFVIEIRPGEDLEDTQVADLLDDDSDVTLLAIKHGDEIATRPAGDRRLRRNDHLVLIGQQGALRRFTDRL